MRNHSPEDANREMFLQHRHARWTAQPIIIENPKIINALEYVFSQKITIEEAGGRDG